MTLRKLSNHAENFRWTELDDQKFDEVTTIVMLTLRMCNPSVRVGVELIKNKIELARMSDFGNYVSKCIHFMIVLYDDVLEQEETHNNIIRDSLKALVPTPNSDFRQ